MLHPLVQTWWPRLVETVEGEGGSVPGFVQRAVERYLSCGLPEAGFIRLRCSDCGTERALSFSCKGRGLCPSCGARRSHDVAHHLVERVLPAVPLRQYVLSPPSELVGLLAARGEALSALNRLFTEAVFEGIRRRTPGEDARHCGSITFLQRFTKTLACYPHGHLLALDGAYREQEDGRLEFIEDPGPSSEDLRALEARVLERFGRWLARHGYLDDETGELDGVDAWWLAAVREPSGVLGPVRDARRTPGFEVHAGVRVAAADRAGREQLVRYVTRPPFAEAQLEILDEERVRLALRSPLRSGQSELILHPLALIPHLRTSLRSGRGHVPSPDDEQARRLPRRVRRLAWLVPPPRQHQLRYAGVLAPAARLRPAVVPAGRISVQGTWFGPRSFTPLSPEPYRIAWARLLARVYDVDGRACPACPGLLRPVGAVLAPQAALWIETGRIYPVGATAPPPGQLSLPLPAAL